MGSTFSARKSATLGIGALRSSPSLIQSSICVRCQASMFSTTSARPGRNSDRNKMRGVSALRRTGPKHPTIVSKEPLPKPVTDATRRSKIKVNEKHGLWEFFDAKKSPFRPPEELSSHGRPWTVDELRQKSFEDLHCLWWVCVKERNRLITQERERARAVAGFGKAEFHDRDEVVKITMRAIRHTLTERWYAYEDALKLANGDPKYRRVLEGIEDGEEDNGEEIDAFEEDMSSKEAQDEDIYGTTRTNPELSETPGEPRTQADSIPPR